MNGVGGTQRTMCYLNEINSEKSKEDREGR